MKISRQVDTVIDDTLIEMKREVAAVRGIRSALLTLAYAIADQGKSKKGILLLIDPKMTDERLSEEVKYAEKVLDPRIARKLDVVVYRNGELRGGEKVMTPDIRCELNRLAGVQLVTKLAKILSTRLYYEVFKVLVHQWLLGKGPMTADWLGKTVGCSYPTVADALRRLGSSIKRHSDRRFELDYFPRDEWARLVAVADRGRATVRFADDSGQQRSPESHLRRLEKLAVPNLAVGGVIGAKHYYPSLDLVGTPRIDLSLHCPQGHMDVGFVEKLDPALQQVKDRHQPASVVVHAVRRKESFFVPGEGALPWADPVECLLDLQEAHLEAQAAELLRYFEKRELQSQ
jgi:hypothetical protein